MSVPTPEREFGQVDLTKWVLRTKYATLTESGMYEVVAAAVYKKDLVAIAKLLHGPKWKRNYEVKQR